MPERLQISDWHKEARCFPADWADHHGDLDDAVIKESWSSFCLDVSAPTINELIVSALDTFMCDGECHGVNSNHYDIDDGTLYVWRMETGEGDMATPSEEKAWHKGEIMLWDCTYSGKIERITPYQEDDPIPRG